MAILLGLAALSVSIGVGFLAGPTLRRRQGRRPYRGAHQYRPGWRWER